MTFFDRKEEVVQIELTPYGKRLLGEGKFQPDSYAFYDDDLLYDSQYGGFTEEQNAAHNRIKETSRTHIQYLFDGVEAGKSIDAFSNLKISPINREYSLPLAMGQADHTQYYPSWDIQFLKGELLTMTGSFSGSTDANNKAVTGPLKIPQLNVGDIIFRTEVVDEPDTSLPRHGAAETDACPDPASGDLENFPLEDGMEGEGFIFADGDTITLKRDYLILEVEEENSSLLDENFHIEIFEIEKDGTLRNLYFQKDPEFIKNDILLDDEEVFAAREEMMDETYAGYYFEVLRDDEIDRALLCSLLPRDNPDGLNSRKMLNCEDFEAHAMARDSLYEYPDASSEEEC